MTVKSKSPVATEVRRTRGPSIARLTRSGKPTAYAVKKDLWSHRGPVTNRVARLGEVGVEIPKSKAIDILNTKDNEAAAPFVLSVKRGKAELLPA